MGFIHQIYCNWCSNIAPGASAPQEESEKIAIQFGWRVVPPTDNQPRDSVQHQCNWCWEESKAKA